MGAEIWRDTKAACSRFTALDAPTRPALHVPMGPQSSQWTALDLQLLEVPEVGRSCPMPQPHSPTQPFKVQRVFISWRSGFRQEGRQLPRFLLDPSERNFESRACCLSLCLQWRRSTVTPK